MKYGQIIANTSYTTARMQSKEGKQLLEKGLVEMRANNFLLARTLMNSALEHFNHAMEAYEHACDNAPTQKQKGKYKRKARMLRICDLESAHIALRRMMPLTEPPIDRDIAYKGLGTSRLI